ncbi:hypothetical protein B0H17DRAFT_1190793 [Mycena rosella]|uniref:Uncharacterized protein n=1 Tax=Mycena rosella TaxID=1033263 RepID=A0AAD7H0S5_MYCRO|nr:hypothetical protein B0H17DRAFT_1190793 [Mycena rosella]
MDNNRSPLNRGLGLLRVRQARRSTGPGGGASVSTHISPSERLPTHEPLLPVHPIHQRSLAVDPQAASPLYNGRIPPEIRNALFEWILAEYTKTDVASAYTQSNRRPGYTGARAINVAFLLACRRIYLEVYHLTAASKEHVFWHARAPVPKYPALNGIGYERWYFARFQPWQISFVKEIHLFTQMYWLEGSFPELCRSGILPRGVERLRITLRARDWWYNENNYPFYILPYKAGGALPGMLAEIAREERGEAVPWDKSGWGSAFKNLQALKTLEMEFETTMNRKGEMTKIVNRALTWRFPMGERGVLSNQGLGAEFAQWQGDKDSFCVFTVKWKLVGKNVN